jgi:probable F420-dependent oxidoreductase
MKLGFVLPHIGPLASRDAIVTTAQAAEALGYDSLWVTERLLYPIAPRSPYPVTPDGALPEQFRRNLDPLAALTLAAASTERIRLGTSVLDMPYYNPVMLARSLATLDILSDGRLDVGLGLGWSQDEVEAAGGWTTARGRRSDEFIAVLKAVWGADPVEFAGEFYQVPRSIIAAKPVQQPHPPLYLAAYTASGLRRVANHANGWNAAGIPIEGMAQMITGIRAMATEAGRDPEAIALVVRANVYLTEDDLPTERPIFSGSAAQVAEDIVGTRDMGASELFFDLTFSQTSATLTDLLDGMRQMYEAAQRPSLVAARS